MRLFASIRMECLRFLKKRSFWLLLLVTAAAPIAGLFYQPIYGSTRNALYLGNPAYVGGVLGAMFWGIFTLVSANREKAWGMDILQDAVYSPFVRKTARLLALCLLAFFTEVGICLVYLPWTCWKTGTAWNVGLYFSAYVLFSLFSIWFAILAASGIYSFWERADLSAITFLVFYLMCWNGSVSSSYLLPWVKPAVNFMSDDFGNVRMLQSAAYNRLFWLMLLSAFFLLGLFATRRYEKGFFGSMRANRKKLLFAVLGLALGILAGNLFVYQPFVDHSSKDLSTIGTMMVEYAEELKLLESDVELKTDTFLGTLKAKGSYRIQNLTGEEQQAVMQINPGYTVKNMTANGEEIPFTEGSDYDNTKDITFTLPAEEEILLEFEYGGLPQEWSIIEYNQGMLEISRESICLGRLELTPALQMDYDDTLKTTLRMTLPENLTPVMGGRVEVSLKEENGDGTNTWESISNDPTPRLYAGDYVSRTISLENGGEVQLWYSQKHEAAMDEIQIDETLKNVFDYCETHYGSLGFGEENGLRLLETSVYLSGGYASDGMSVMDESSFSEEGFKDEKKGASGSEVLAHEITHQWWGLACQFWEDAEHPEWSSEGVTVYTTYRMMKEWKGEEYAETYYLNAWKEAVEDYYQDFYVRNPEYLEKLPEDLQYLVSGSRTTVEQYSLMPLKLWKAEQILGEERMDEVLAELFQMGYLGCTYQDFLEISGLEEEDLYVEETYGV
ncbi:MAG: hypothetical protein Q4F41_12460 [Eubacteriales bacterium]|nr:hypothetical protein [Eubacteriales bacterium]